MTEPLYPPNDAMKLRLVEDVLFNRPWCEAEACCRNVEDLKMIVRGAPPDEWRRRCGLSGAA